MIYATDGAAVCKTRCQIGHCSISLLITRLDELGTCQLTDPVDGLKVIHLQFHEPSKIYF
jgi:hypothetical protein